MPGTHLFTKTLLTAIAASLALLALAGCEKSGETNKPAAADTASIASATTPSGSTTPAALDIECPAGSLANPLKGTCDTCGGSPRCEEALADCGEGGNHCLDEGLVFARGANGLVDDLVRASGLFDAACEAGNLKACNNLGVHRERGLGIAQDADEALKLYQKSCTEEAFDGCVNLAAMYESKGKLASAHQLYEQSCERDEAVGCYNLGVSLERSPPGVRDLARARALYDKACQKDHPAACHNLATMHVKLSPDDRDALASARSLYARACSLGHPSGACRSAGAMFEQGKGGDRDLTRARELFDVGCRAGDMNACARFALFDVRGLAGKENIPRAVKLSMLACSNAEMLGCTTLGTLDERDVVEAKAGLFAARRELERRCDTKNAQACDALGSLAMRGIGQKRDLEQGFAFFRQACDLGAKIACARLEKLPGAKKP